MTLSEIVKIDKKIYIRLYKSKSLLFSLKWTIAGADPGFQVRGAHLKKLRRAEGGAKFFGVFYVKNHDFTPKKSYFSNFRGGARNFWGISCEKSRFYAKKIIFFPILGWARAGCAPPPPPMNPPLNCSAILSRVLLMYAHLACSEIWVDMFAVCFLYFPVDQIFSTKNRHYISLRLHDDICL